MGAQAGSFGTGTSKQEKTVKISSRHSSRTQRRNSGAGPRSAALALCAVAALSAPLRAQAQSSDGTKNPVALYLVPSVLQALANVASQGVGCLMQRLFHGWGMASKPECDSRTSDGSLQGVSRENAIDLARQPVLSFEVQKLNSALPNAGIAGRLARGKLAGDDAPQFTIRTGEVFAIAFTTTVPGRVQLYATDTHGGASRSELYEAVPGEDKRIPRANKPGIVMQGLPGPETIEVSFQPCVAASLAHLPAVAPFKGVIPDCGGESATRGGGGTEVIGTAGSKLAAFPENGDSAQSTAIPPGNYERGNVLRFTIKIDHQPAT